MIPKASQKESEIFNVKVGVIIVAFNDPSVLRRCIDSIRESSLANVEIIVIDNSTNGEVRQSLDKEKGLHYLSMGGNSGFCRANNVGIQKSQELNSHYTLLLNHDTVVMHDCLASLVECCSRFNDEVAVAGKILYLGMPEKIWYAGGRLSLLIGVGIHYGFNRVDDGNYDVSREVSYATGCCLLLPTKAFKVIGRLRDNMFMYLDDAEYSWRICHSGFSIRYEPRAVLYHEVGPGVGFRNYSDYYLYFSIRNKPLVANGAFYKFYLHCFGFILGMTKIILYSTLTGIEKRPVKIRALLWGIQDSFSSQERYIRRFPRLFLDSTGKRNS